MEFFDAAPATAETAPVGGTADTGEANNGNAEMTPNTISFFTRLLPLFGNHSQMNLGISH